MIKKEALVVCAGGSGHEAGFTGTTNKERMHARRSVDGSILFEFQEMSVSERLDQMKTKLGDSLQDVTTALDDNQQHTEAADMLVKAFVRAPYLGRMVHDQGMCCFR